VLSLVFALPRLPVLVALMEFACAINWATLPLFFIVPQQRIVVSEKGEDGFQARLDAKYYHSELDMEMILFVDLLFLECRLIEYF